VSQLEFGFYYDRKKVRTKNNIRTIQYTMCYVEICSKTYLFVKLFGFNDRWNHYQEWTQRISSKSSNCWNVL